LAARKQGHCKIVGCSRPVHARGLCQKHYDVSRKRSGKRASSGANANCSVSGCKQPHHARGLCQIHYDELRKRVAGRAGAGAGSAAAPSGRICRVPGCTQPHHAKGYCKRHYGQLIRDGAVGMTADSSGRRYTRSERLSVLRHRHERLRREIESIHKAFEAEAGKD